MLNITDMEVHTIRHKNRVEQNKPTCTRNLNFGQSILTLNTVKQFHGQKGGTLLINKNVTNIPCTEKIEFVRKWIESHEDRILNTNNVSALSPTLGSSTTGHAQTSPVFGNNRKRTKRIADLNSSFVDNNIREVDCSPSIGNNKRKKVCRNSRKENVRKNLFNSQICANTSPVLDKNFYRYKKRRKKLENNNSKRMVLEQIVNKHMDTSARTVLVSREMYEQKGSPVLVKNYYSNKRKYRKLTEDTLPQMFLDKVENSCVDTNMNSITSHNFLDKQHPEEEYKIMCTQKQQELIKKLEYNCINDDLKSSMSEDSKISEISMEFNSAISKTKLHIDDSPKDIRDTMKMNIESSNENEDDCNDIVTTNSDTDKDVSDQIEYTDTQDIGTTENSKLDLQHSSLVIDSKPASVTSQVSTKDSDQTFYEEAEQHKSLFSNIQSSQKISQVLTQVNDLTDIKSTQSGIIISSETSPGKTHPDPSVQLNLLDSGKKRKKPKRGSLSQRLQSAVNSQISFVRIWRYQLKQMNKDNISVPCVTIFVLACITRFSRQFLEGIVIEDSFKLLSPEEKSSSSTLIKIMTIPDIVGKIEMKSKGTVQIFPPWEILDDKNLMLHVTYIRAAPHSNTEKNESNSEQAKQLIVREFDCPCINANKIIPSCVDRLNKPNVIEKLFID